MTKERRRPRPTETGPHRPESPDRIRVPVMRQRWEALTFLHWPYPVVAVQRLLPPALAVEPWEGRAWVGLVPFFMRVRPPLAPAIPGVTTFPETNLRTYVIGPDGRSGVWFFSLDAANWPAVVTGRAAYGLPYHKAKMRLERDSRSVRYRSTRSEGTAQSATTSRWSRERRSHRIG